MLQTISVGIASASIVIGVIYYGLQIRHQSRTRDTDMVIRLSSAFDNVEFTNAYTRIATTKSDSLKDFVEKCSPQALFMVGNYYERIGVLLHRKLIDAGLISDILNVEVMWETMKPYVLYMRERYGSATFEWFEYLYDEVKKREQKLQHMTE
jgi:hypothetical protein